MIQTIYKGNAKMPNIMQEEKLINLQRKKQEEFLIFNLDASNILSRIKSKISLYIADYVYYRLLLREFRKGLFYNTHKSINNSLKMIALIHRVKKNTAVFIPQLSLLYKLSKDIENRSVLGDVVECGVFNGGSAAIIASICCKESRLDRKMWLFDSFEGLPNPTAIDGEKAKYYEMFGNKALMCHGDLSEVKKIFRKFEIPMSDIQIVKGWFHETFPCVEINKISLLHIDADWYESVKLCLETFYDNVQPGGFIVIDDYVFWEGCKKATDEFLKEKVPGIKLTRVGHAGCYIQKPMQA